VKRVLWDHNHGWEEPQRFGPDHHRPIRLEESCEQGGRRGVQAGSVAGEEGGPQRVVQMEDEIWGLQEWVWHSPREAEVDSGGPPGGVKAGHSNAWASKPADLARHWLGETEDASEELLQSEPADLARYWLRETKDASEELLRTVQEPGEEAGRPRVEAGHSEAWASEPADLARHWLGETEDASKELLRTVRGPEEEAEEEVSQQGEHECSSELGGDDSSRTRHHADLHSSEDCHTETVEAERPRPHGASSEAPREQVLQGGEREGWPGSCKRVQRQVDLSRRAGTMVSKKRKLPSGSV
jgi:hypothetical protein